MYVWTKQSWGMIAVDSSEFHWRFSDPVRMGLNQPLLLTLNHYFTSSVWLSLLSPVTPGPQLSLPLQTDLEQQGPSAVSGLCEVTNAVRCRVTPCHHCLFSLSFIVHSQLSGHRTFLTSHVALFIGYDDLSK